MKANPVIIIQRARQTYLKENRYNSPKEVHKVIANIALQTGVLEEGSVVCDFGCAAGEFLHHLQCLFPKAKYYGYDIVPELIEKARGIVPSVVFQLGSVLDRALLPGSSVDVAFMIGVHSIFDEFETSFSNLLYWVRRGGRIYIFGLFNPHPIDVWVKYRLADDPDPGRREPGWNMFSKVSVSRYLDAAVGVGKHTFIPFEMPFDLAPNPEDPVRTWTFLDNQNRRLLTDGLSLLCNLEILEIRP